MLEKNLIASEIEIEALRQDCGFDEYLSKTYSTISNNYSKLGRRHALIIWQVISELVYSRSVWGTEIIKHDPQAWGKPCFEETILFKRKGSKLEMYQMEIEVVLKDNKLTTEYDYRNAEFMDPDDDWRALLGCHECDISQYVFAGVPMEVDYIKCNFGEDHWQCMFSKSSLRITFDDEICSKKILERIEEHCKFLDICYQDSKENS